jgi:hypothetical protein
VEIKADRNHLLMQETAEGPALDGLLWQDIARWIVSR